MNLILIAATACTVFFAPHESVQGKNTTGHAINQALQPTWMEFEVGKGWTIYFDGPRNIDDLQRRLDDKDGRGLKLRCLG